MKRRHQRRGRFRCRRSRLRSLVRVTTQEERLPSRRSTAAVLLLVGAVVWSHAWLPRGTVQNVSDLHTCLSLQESSRSHSLMLQVPPSLHSQLLPPPSSSLRSLPGPRARPPFPAPRLDAHHVLLLEQTLWIPARLRLTERPHPPCAPPTPLLALLLCI